MMEPIGAVHPWARQASPAARRPASHALMQASAARRRSSSVRFGLLDRKSTRLNSSHVEISYAVFCLKKKKYDAHFGFDLQFFEYAQNLLACLSQVDQLLVLTINQYLGNKLCNPLSNTLLIAFLTSYW